MKLTLSHLPDGERKMPYVTSWERIGEKKGKKEGKREVRLETAKRMLSDNFSAETIAKYTGLKEKEIRSLKNINEPTKSSSVRVSRVSQ
jgi:predicted transposase/invertase (TIGR01784 family)